MSSPQKIDDYTLLYECGHGAFGTVYLAKDSQDRYVALKKVMLSDNAKKYELQAVNRYCKCSGRTHLLQIFEVIQKREPPPPYFYYTMEPADNMAGENSDTYMPCTLSEVLKRQKRLTVAQTTELIGQILQDLAVIHENHLVHRDIKPANIFWVNRRAKLGDIGLLAAENSLTCKAGSPGFMPPANSAIDVNSTAVDLFAITRLIYVCLSGRKASDYSELEPSDDLFEHGTRLLAVMNLSNKRLATMTVRDIQEILQPESAFKTVMSSVSVMASKSMAAEPDVLADLSALNETSSAGSWLEKHKIDGRALATAGAVGLGTALAGPALGIVGGPVVLGAAAIAYLFKKAQKK